MADKLILFIESDNDIFWPARNHRTDALLTSGTVTMTLTDANDATITLADSSMAYNATRGGWEGNVDSAAALTEDATYTLKLVGSWSGPDNARKIACVAKWQGVR